MKKSIFTLLLLVAAQTGTAQECLSVKDMISLMNESCASFVRNGSYQIQEFTGSVDAKTAKLVKVAFLDFEGKLKAKFKDEEFENTDRKDLPQELQNNRACREAFNESFKPLMCAFQKANNN